MRIVDHEKDLKIIKNPKINKKSPYGDGKAGKKVSLLLEKICK